MVPKHQYDSVVLCKKNYQDETKIVLLIIPFDCAGGAQEVGAAAVPVVCRAVTRMQWLRHERFADSPRAAQNGVVVERYWCQVKSRGEADCKDFNRAEH
jgi:hypothetical protein